MTWDFFFKVPCISDSKKPLSYLKMFVFGSQDVTHKLASHFSHHTNQFLLLEKHYHVCFYCSFVARVFFLLYLSTKNQLETDTGTFLSGHESRCNLLRCLIASLCYPERAASERPGGCSVLMPGPSSLRPSGVCPSRI